MSGELGSYHVEWVCRALLTGCFSWMYEDFG